MVCRKKDIVTFLCHLFLVALCFSQNAEDVASLKEIDSLTKNMFHYMNSRDYDAILDMTHPKVFDMVPKASMKTMLKSTFEGNEEFSMDIPKMSPKYKISDLFKEEKDNLIYAFVSFDMNMKMTFHKQEFDEETKKTMVSMMSLKGMNVKFITNNTLDVKMNNRLTIVMQDDTTNNAWVMVNYDVESPLFYQIVPTAVLEKAKEYYQDLMIASKKSNEK
ncbi:hypothetical protein MHTCC0001_24490 [Flavobacteriaceae bacterium MHTCC 0001]